MSTRPDVILQGIFGGLNVLVCMEPEASFSRGGVRHKSYTFATMMRKLYIIVGCNGAGKTTASYTVLPEMLGCKEFVNADEIAKGLLPFNPESVAIEAGRLML